MKNIFLIQFIVFPFLVFSQIEIKGIVKDSTSQIVYVHIILTSDNGSLIKSGIPSLVDRIS